jgi:uncharacterized alkaline shock family protein YloU
VTEPNSDAPARRDISETERLADRVAAAVSQVRGVARLMPGPIATYLPGRTVQGVAVRDGTVVVSVVARYGESLPEVADRVRAASRRAAPDLKVDVLIDDVEVEGK